MLELKNKLEDLIRRGQFAEVERQFNSLQLNKIVRSEACAMATIARRINRPRLVLRILGPIVRTEEQLSRPPSASEKMEYADALRRLGAVEEAHQILSEIDSVENPQVFLHRAFCNFNQWRYAESIPLLNQYISSLEVNSYPYLVAQVNLAAAIVFEERIEEAHHLLQYLRTQTQVQNHVLLNAHSLELSAQVCLLENNWKMAAQHLEAAAPILRKAGKFQHLLLRKWQAVTDSLQAQQISPKLRNVLKMAQRIHHWETWRDCEYQMIRISHDPQMTQNLYFGTPFQSFRRRIQKIMAADFSWPDDFVWTQNQKPTIILDVASGRFHGKGGPEALRPAGTLHRLLISLSEDLYVPQSTLSLFSKMFPGELINPITSANRVHQVVKRLRKWMEPFHQSFEIEEVAGGYRFRLIGASGLRVSLHTVNVQSQVLIWNQFREACGRASFPLSEFARVLGISNSKAQGLVRWALQQKLIQKKGQSSATIYEWV